MIESFVEKYRPETIDDIAGNNKNLKKIKKWAEAWEKGDKPIVLHGPAGVGKTSTAEALANDMEWEFTEINASDKKTRDDIIALGRSLRSGNIGEGKRLYLLDDVDAFDGRSLSPLLKVLKECPQPVIMTCNDLWKVPQSIQNLSDDYKFSLGKNSIKPILRNVAQEEGIDITSRKLGQLATRNGLRDALNDLQRFSDDTSAVGWDERETEDSPFAVTERVLRNKDYIGGRDMTPPDMVDFLDENLPGEFHGVELLRAYQALSEADKWNHKVNKTQNYTYWRYSGAISEQVANIRVSEPYEGYMNINYPTSRRVSSPSPSFSSPEGKLYEEIKEVNTPNYKASFNYREFEADILPTLKDMEKEQKMQFILSESLSFDAMKALGVTRKQFEEWSGGEVETEEEVEENRQDSQNESSDSGRSLFDF